MKRGAIQAAPPAAMSLAPDGERWFLGEFEFAVDGQRRVALPSAWREGHGDDDAFVLMPGRDESLQLLPAGMFRELVRRLQQVSFADAQAALALATIGSKAVSCRPDRQGRFMLTQPLLDHAGITTRAVLVGAISTVQIWQPEAWAKRRMDNHRGLDVIQAIQERPGPLNDVLGSLLRPKT